MSAEPKNAPVRREARPAYDLVGDRMVILASGEETGGQYVVIDSEVLPGGGPPPHIHRKEHEAFFVLEGRITVFTPEKSWEIGPGSFIHLPLGGTHWYRNTGGVTARMLVITVPSGFDSFIKKAGRLADRSVPPTAPSPIDFPRIIGVAAEFGIEIVPLAG